MTGFESASCFHFQVGVAVSPAVYRQQLLKTDGSPTKMDHNAKKQDHDDDDDDVLILYFLYGQFILVMKKSELQNLLSKNIPAL